MIDPDNRLFCHLDDTTAQEQEQQRLLALTQLGLLQAGSVLVFEEATQTAAHFLQTPICILGLMERDRQLFKAAVGLSRLGLMNELAAARSLPRSEAFCDRVVETYKAVAIPDTTANPSTSDNILVQRYGIRAYLGVPLLTSGGCCIGTLAVMDLEPRTFTERDIQYLELMARWSMSEYERNALLKAPSGVKEHPELTSLAPYDRSATELPATTAENSLSVLGDRTHYKLATHQVKVELLNQLTEELRTPLTSVMGMASVLSRETYGPLTGKQKEYLDIIHHSGQYLLSLVNEILELGIADRTTADLKLTSVDIEMLCQQVMNSLEHIAKRREQQMRLSVEPGNRIWLLDKAVVRQIVYHLVSSVIQSANAESIVRLHVSRKNKRLNIAVGVSHPWLGEGLPMSEIEASTDIPAISGVGNRYGSDAAVQLYEPEFNESYAPVRLDTNGLAAENSTDLLVAAEEIEADMKSGASQGAENLRLLLSRHLVQMHGGQVTIQGSAESGYRYVVIFPDMTNWEEII